MSSRPQVSFKDLSSKSILGLMDKFVWSDILPRDQAKSSQANIDIFGSPMMLKDMVTAGRILEQRQEEAKFNADGIMESYSGLYYRVWEQIFRGIFADTVRESIDMCIATGCWFNMGAGMDGVPINVDCNNFLRMALISRHGSIMDGIYDEYFQNTCCLVDSVVGWSSMGSIVHLELTNSPEYVMERMQQEGKRIHQGNFVFPEGIARYERVIGWSLQKIRELRPDISLPSFLENFNELRQTELDYLRKNNQQPRGDDKIIGFVFPHQLHKESITNFGIGATKEEKDQALMREITSYFVALISVYGISSIESVLCMAMPSLIERTDTTDLFFICTVKIDSSLGIPLAVDHFSAEQDTTLLYRALIHRGSDTILARNLSVFDERVSLCIHEIVGLDQQEKCGWCGRINKAALQREHVVHRGTGGAGVEISLSDLERDAADEHNQQQQQQQEQQIQDLEIHDMEQRLNQLLEESDVDVFMDSEESKNSDARLSAPLDKIMESHGRRAIDDRTAELRLQHVLKTYEAIIIKKTMRVEQLANENQFYVDQLRNCEYDGQRQELLGLLELGRTRTSYLSRMIGNIRTLMDSARFHIARLNGKLGVGESRRIRVRAPRPEF